MNILKYNAILFLKLQIMINKVILIGNLGKDPEVKKLENNNAVARFTLATNESYMDKSGEWQKQTEWHNIVIWGNLAERAEKYLHKGSTIFLEGKLKTRKYTDSNNIERYTTEIFGLSFRVLDKREPDGTIPSPENFSGSNSVENHNYDQRTQDNSEDQIDDLPF